MIKGTVQVHGALRCTRIRARATAADFARSVLAPAARAADEAAALPAPLRGAIWALGLVQAIAAAEPGLLEQPTVLNALLRYLELETVRALRDDLAARRGRGRSGRWPAAPGPAASA